MDQSYGFYKSTLDHMLEGCQVIGVDWRYLYLNEAAARQGRRGRSELIGRRMMDAYPGIEQTPLFALLSRCMETRTPARVPNQFEFPDGTTGWFELSVQPVPEGLLILSLDITEHKRAAERVRRTNRVLAVLSQINQSIVRVRDPRGVLARACDIAVEHGGFAMAWVGLVDPSRQWLRAVAQPSGAGGALTELDLPLASGPPIRCPAVEAALGARRVVRPLEADGAGRALCQELAIGLGARSEACLPMVVGGRVRGVVSLYATDPGAFDDEEVELLEEMVLDLAFALEFAESESERRAAQRQTAVHLAMQRVRNAVLRMEDERDWEGVVALLARELHGLVAYHRMGVHVIDWERNEVTYYGVHQGVACVSRSHRTQVQPVLRQTVEGGRAVHRRRGDAQFGPDIRDDVNAVVDVPFLGGTLAMNGTDLAGFSADDIATLEQFAQVMSEAHRRLGDLKALDLAQRQLHQSQKLEAIGQLAGGVAHDFNNLLTVITGYAEILQEAAAGRRDLAEPLGLIQDAGRQAIALTRQLLAFSRRQILQPEVVDLNAVVGRLGKMLQRLLGEDIDLVTSLAPAVDPVTCDPGQVEQIVMNLAVNARDAMPQGGKLTIETANATIDEAYARSHPGARPGAYVMIAMTDTGVGMDRATQARIFEPFFTTKELGHGTGLGLSTVYGIVKQSGGNIWVYSEPGQGTAFRIYLPRTEAAGAPAPPPVAQEETPRGHEAILVVEDHDGVRSLIRTALVAAGYAVFDTGDVDEALRLCREGGEAIDLLLTDVVLPKMSGRDLAQRAVAARPDLRVAYMSGYTDRAIVHHGVLTPGVAFIPKPIAPDELLRKVREFLA